MQPATNTDTCRLSGEKLAAGRELFSVNSFPLAGSYPSDRAESVSLRVPMRVVQARESRLVQLGHRLDPVVYKKYAFAGAVSKGYSRHQANLAGEITRHFGPESLVLEIGCGDAYLLKQLQRAGFNHVYGMEPSCVVRPGGTGLDIVSGYFPDDIPTRWRELKFDLILIRQVIEHIESPVDLVKELPTRLRTNGEVWVEVPDLESTVAGKLFSNFYPLHCSYFTTHTLSSLMARAGLSPHETRIVDVFGGSILARYKPGTGQSTPSRFDNFDWDITNDLNAFTRAITLGVEQMPDGTVGYGAAERTASVVGFCPSIEGRIDCLYDRNPLLHGRFLGGTSLGIKNTSSLFHRPPPGLVLFAISHKAELMAEFAKQLPGRTVIMIADASAKRGRLDVLADGMASRNSA